MSDTKNVILAWVSAGTTLLTNVSDGLIPLVSAVVLPIIFFTVGKTVDVLLQLYIRRDRNRDATGSEGAPETDIGNATRRERAINSETTERAR